MQAKLIGIGLFVLAILGAVIYILMWGKSQQKMGEKLAQLDQARKVINHVRTQKQVDAIVESMSDFDRSHFDELRKL